MKTIAVLAFSFAFCSIRILHAADEIAAFADFQRLAVQSDVKAAHEQFKRDHPGTASKQDAEVFEKARVEAAMILLDRAKEFETQYSQSAHLAEVRGLTLENLWTVFGAIGLPIPKTRTAEVEDWTRKRLVDDPKDYRPYMILVRVAGALPPSKQEAALEELSQVKVPEPARSMAKDVLQNLKRLGHPLELKFTALDGRNVDLAALKGKVVLIDFWSTACVPCVREMPDLKKLHSKYKAEGFEVIGVTLDEDKEILQRYIEKEQIPWPQYYDAQGSRNRLAEDFAIRSIPVVWLIDRKGILRDLDGRDDQERKITELLKDH